jgi:hypothetical protein
MDLVSALLGAVVGALLGGFVSVRAAAPHWQRDRLLAAWTSIIEELATLMTILPTVDQAKISQSEKERESAERLFHAPVTILDRQVAVLGLLGDDEAADLMKEAQDCLWDVVFLIGPGPPSPAVDPEMRAGAVGASTWRALGAVEDASSALSLRGRQRVAVWTRWLPRRTRRARTSAPNVDPSSEPAAP